MERAHSVVARGRFVAALQAMTGVGGGSGSLALIGFLLYERYCVSRRGLTVDADVLGVFLVRRFACFLFAIKACLHFIFKYV